MSASASPFGLPSSGFSAISDALKRERAIGMSADVKQRLFTVPETSKILARSEPSIWRDLRAKRLDAVRINGSTRVTGESIDRVCTPSKP
jgi:hypothetical protein